MSNGNDRTPKTPAEQRQQRLAAQLRTNLQRRKAQARARRAGDPDSRPAGLPAARTPGSDDSA